ncbi:MAG: putative cystine transporter YijE [Paracidovorax wautersii]|uniref:Putative cystine transporter YijE n=1 Tax=Paracidovorax wautersii TaxID=1177982 RepID=A0A7V8FL34_9BURK|nr:MAG: putative cystine transporter YijE [Paracidovorax wautersii]
MSSRLPSPLAPIAALPAPLLSARARGLALLLLAIVVWGCNWPVMKAGLDHVTPIWFSALRFATGGLCLFAIQLATGTLKLPTRRDLPLLASVGLLQMMAFTALGAIAMTQVTAGRSAVLAYTTPLWVAPIAVLAFGERLSRLQGAGLMLGLAGLGLLFNPLAMDWHDGAAVQTNLMLMAGSFLWGMTILHLRYYRADSSAYQLAPWQMLVATVPLLALAYGVEGPFTGDGSRALWEIVLFVGPLATAFCFCAVNAASMSLSATSMATAMLGVPLIGLAAATLFLGEALSLPLVAGGLCIVGGILVVSLGARSRAR